MTDNLRTAIERAVNLSGPIHDPHVAVDALLSVFDGICREVAAEELESAADRLWDKSGPDVRVAIRERAAVLRRVEPPPSAVQRDWNGGWAVAQYAHLTELSRRYCRDCDDWETQRDHDEAHRNDEGGY